MCVSIVVCPIEPTFSVTNVSFTGHFVANPATNFTDKREGAIGRDAKKHENTTVLNRQKRTLCVFKCWLNCQPASFEALLSIEKNHRRANAIVERGPFFCVLSHKNDIRQHCVISQVFSYHVGGTCPVKDFSWSWNGALLETEKKGLDARPHASSNQGKASQVKSSQVKSSQVKSSQVKSSQVKSSQVKSSQVKVKKSSNHK